MKILATCCARLCPWQSVVRNQPIILGNCILSLYLIEDRLLVELGKAAFKVKIAHLLHIRSVLCRPTILLSLPVSPPLPFQRRKGLK
jgi:hypothetical protein